MLSIVLIGGIVMLAVLLFLKSSFTRVIPSDNRLTKMLAAASWFRNAGWSGLFLFLMNAFLFGATGALLYLLTCIC